MVKLIFRRLLQMILIMAVISFVIFMIFDSDKFKKQIAVNELSGLTVSTMDEVAYRKWLKSKGLDAPFHERYVNWLGGLFQGDLGMSLEKNEKVSKLIGDKLANTGILAFWVFFLMIPLSLTLGIISGMKEGSIRDRTVSFISVFTTSIPEIATAIILTVVFALSLGWLPSKSTATGQWEFWQLLVLPVMTLVIYDFGYVARMTRASMAEVMTSQYIRTAVLKGIPYRRVVMKHALRNALIAPFTVIVLQLNWLLSGVVVVEVFFQYDGFGKLLLDAALYGDIYVIQAATLVAVFVAVLSQIISDVGYTFLNPRIRFS